MVVKREITLLVGDNPFHGISHLSQDRAIARGNDIRRVDYAAKLVTTALDNGADGFMFSVSDTTLSILKAIGEPKKASPLYAIVPYAYEYVRLATQLGISGLASKLIKQIVFSGNIKAIVEGLKGVTRMDLEAIMKTYIYYEMSRVKAAMGKKPVLEAFILHEIITDMAAALKMDRFFRSYIGFLEKLKIKPGFETRNFAYLVNRFKDWDIDFSRVVIATPFNKVGFQMNPSREVCERALSELPDANVIAMSVLAAGYLKLPDAIEYVESLPNVGSVVIGISKENHAYETFKFVRERFEPNL